MSVKAKHLVGVGCIAAGLVAGNVSAEGFFPLCGDCYLGGSFGKAFTSKKISGRTIPIARDARMVTNGDTQELTYKKANAMSFFFGTKINELRYQIEFSSVETKHKDLWNNHETTGGIRANLNPLSDEHTKALSIMPQVFYDFSIPNTKDFIPYLGAGLGYSKVRNHVINGGFNFSETQKQNKLAGQLIAGVRYKVASNLAVSLDYKYFRPFGKIKALDSSYYNHSVQAGIVVNI